jgi:hypothetical protein
LHYLFTGRLSRKVWRPERYRRGDANRPVNVLKQTLQPCDSGCWFKVMANAAVHDELASNIQAI